MYACVTPIDMYVLLHMYIHMHGHTLATPSSPIPKLGGSQSMCDLVRHHFIQCHLKEGLDEKRRKHGGSAMGWAWYDIYPALKQIRGKERTLQQEKGRLIRFVDGCGEADTGEEDGDGTPERKAHAVKRLKAIRNELGKCAMDKTDAIAHNVITRGRFRVRVYVHMDIRYET